MTPFLTVVMPLHAGERFLRPTLASVAAENPEGVRILAYDSSDAPAATRAIVADFKSTLDIDYRSTPDLKPWQSKVNLGILEAETAHVAILHQDDLWLPGHLDALRSAIAAHPDAPLSIAPSLFIDSNDRKVGTWHLPFPAGVISGRAFFNKVIVQNTIAVPSAVYLRQAWIRVGQMDEALWYTPDWDIYLRLAAVGDIVVRRNITTAFRLHGSSLTLSGSADIDGFRHQLETVLTRHEALWQLDPSSPLGRRAHLSVDLNCALAQAAGGKYSALVPLLPKLAKLGPCALYAFLGETRLLDRVTARIPLLIGS